MMHVVFILLSRIFFLVSEEGREFESVTNMMNYLLVFEDLKCEGEKCFPSLEIAPSSKV
jgi:hypothetical protein